MQSRGCWVKLFLRFTIACQDLIGVIVNGLYLNESKEDMHIREKYLFDGYSICPFSKVLQLCTARIVIDFHKVLQVIDNLC
jgi:hypothetical protein